jgi:DNA-binding HxlR family transcriptional regulator/putative sterol carrier protein
LARALDLVGERWTLLIVRDLAVAPRRFTDLLGGLPGMGTSLLSERLRTLEDDGVIRRTVADRPARSVVYELTESGRQLAAAIAPLGVWGATHLGAVADAEFRPDWMVFTIRSLFRPEAARGVHDCYEFRLADFTLWVAVDDGQLSITEHEPRPADFVIITDVATLAALGNGQVSPETAVAEGRAQYHGDADAGLRAMRIFGAPNG